MSLQQALKSWRNVTELAFLDIVMFLFVLKNLCQGFRLLQKSLSMRLGIQSTFFHFPSHFNDDFSVVRKTIFEISAKKMHGNLHFTET